MHNIMSMLRRSLKPFGGINTRSLVRFCSYLESFTDETRRELRDYVLKCGFIFTPVYQPDFYCRVFLFCVLYFMNNTLQRGEETKKKRCDLQMLTNKLMFYGFTHKVWSCLLISKLNAQLA